MREGVMVNENNGNVTRNRNRYGRDFYWDMIHWDIGWDVIKNIARDKIVYRSRYEI